MGFIPTFAMLVQFPSTPSSRVATYVQSITRLSNRFQSTPPSRVAAAEHHGPRRLLSGGTSAKLRGGARTNRFEALFLSPAIPSGANAEGCLLATRGHPFHPTPPFERAALGNPHDLGTPFPSSQSRLPAPSRFITHFKSVFQPTRPFRAVNKQPIDPRICYEFQPTPSTRRVTCLVVSFFCLTGSFQPTPSA